MQSISHYLRAAAVVSFSAITVAACGSAAETTTTSNSGASPSSSNGFLAFSACMRAHGVPNFPDPTGGGGIQINSSSGINPASPSFRAAQSRCTHLLPGGGPGHAGPASAQARKAMLETSECMRAHGVTGFPDPTTKAPGSGGIGNYSIAIGHDGIFLLVPKTVDVASPAFQHAAATCGFGPGGHARAVAAP
jgi:hypothetical protein